MDWIQHERHRHHSGKAAGHFMLTPLEPRRVGLHSEPKETRAFRRCEQLIQWIWMHACASPQIYKCPSQVSTFKSQQDH
eukprot:Skav207378  [mRNA]  locus=scaffold2496:89139:89375:- [translate_table: standard]